MGTALTVDVRGVSKSFGHGRNAVQVLNDVSVKIAEREFFTLLGPSGCGKTTLLRLIAGFEDVDRGDIFIAGQRANDQPPFRRNVNTVFQSYALFPHMTVAENVAFGLERKKVDKAERKTRVAEALELVELSSLASRRPTQMSGGQQQRVALARALVNRPRALLLDEPLGALDLRLRKQLQLELSQIQRDVGITFIHVTHDQEEAMTMADTIAVMRDGRIDQLGSATELYDHPRTAFVANFLGNSNLIDADVVSNSGAFAEVDADGGARLRVPSEPVAAAGSAQVRIGVRPEKMTLAPANGDSAATDSNALLGHIVDAAYIGLATQYVVHTDGGADLQVFVQNSANGTSGLEEGDRVVASWDPEHTFVVEREEPNAG